MWRCLLPLLVLITACTDPDPSVLAIEMAEIQCGITHLQRNRRLTAEQQLQLTELRNRVEACQKKVDGLKGDALREYNRIYYSQIALCR